MFQGEFLAESQKILDIWISVLPIWDLSCISTDYQEPPLWQILLFKRIPIQKYSTWTVYGQQPISSILSNYRLCLMARQSMKYHSLNTLLSHVSSHLPSSQTYKNRNVFSAIFLHRKYHMWLNSCTFKSQMITIKKSLL